MKRFCVAMGLVAFVLGGADAADQTLRLVVGQPATIDLDENPSTGYGWAIDTQASSNLSLLDVEDRGFSKQADDKAIGAPGIHRWSVRATSPGNASITFVYRRPWETSVARRHLVVIEATAR